MSSLEQSESLVSSLRSVADAISRQTDVLASATRPYVTADAYPKHHVNILYFRLRNVGQTPAYRIRITIDPPINVLKQPSNELNIFNTCVGVLGPHEEISFILDSAIELFGRDNPTLVFRVQMRYEDSQAQSYEDTVDIDLSLFRGLAIETPTSDKMADTLERIQRATESIERYFDRLRTKELIASIQEPEQKEMKRSTKKHSAKTPQG